MSASPPSDPLAAGLAAASALQQRGDVAGARRALLDLLAAFPGHPSVHRALGLLAANTGARDEALRELRAAVAAAPGVASLQVELGSVLAHGGDFAAALPHFEAATRLQPGLALAWHLRGITLVRLQDDAAALPVLRRAHALAPDQTPTLLALAQAEFRSGFPADALPLWQEVRRRRPDAEAVLKLGETLSRMGRQDEAAALYRDALQRQGDDADLWMALAQGEEDEGHRDAAEAAYQRALALRPGWAFPLAGLLGLRRGKAAPEHVAAATARLGDDIPDPERALLGYELGKVYDGRGEYREAMARWDDANAARRRMIGDYDDGDIRARGEAIVADWPAQVFAAGPRPGHDPDPRPLFVVGMPRSGTTLTESILSAHPQIFGCGELAELGLVAALAPLRPGRARRWPPGPDDLHPDALAWAAPRWLEAATRRAPADALRLVDKSPLNFQLLGLAALLFPNARVVWCRRDPRDVAVSIYGENFSLDERFATRLEGIAGFINLEQRLMRHWQQVLPLPILELRYEALVTDVEAQVRRLIHFAGLPWDPACLDFHRSERGVQTPSRWQVRQPVHARSVGRWRNYGFALGPLLAALDDAPEGG